MSQLNPYLTFDGTAKPAIEFYKSIFGGVLTFTTFKSSGMPHDASEEDRIMHAQLVCDHFVLMASDITKNSELKIGNNVSNSLSGDNEAELRGYWEKLVVGGTVLEPLEKAPWGDFFGMVTDQFGVRWMINIMPKK